jgi:phosphocarrier protein HPr
MIDPLVWPPGGQTPLTGGTITREIMITNKRGLHARASAKFVQCVELYQCHVTVTKGGDTVGGTSIMGLMMLAAGPGTTITVTSKGYEARECLDALEGLLSEKFGEEE